jgi:hypothetical protein
MSYHTSNFGSSRFQPEFLLFTDACDYGIGSVLSQMQDGVEKPIAYGSRQLKPA